jgi:hypothetical protein
MLQRRLFRRHAPEHPIVRVNHEPHTTRHKPLSAQQARISSSFRE